MTPAPPRETASQALRLLGPAAEERGWRVDPDPDTHHAAMLRVPIAEPDGSGAGERLWPIYASDVGLNTAAAARLAADKLMQHRVLDSAGLPTLPAVEFTRRQAERCEPPPGFDVPVVVKPNTGSGGRGVSVVRERNRLRAAWTAAADADRRPHHDRPPIVLAQRHDPRPEARVLVLEGRVLAAFAKHPEMTGGPANLSAGAEWTDATADLSPVHGDLSACATAALGLTFAAADLLHDPVCAGDAPTVLEVNASPGLRALDALPADRRSAIAGSILDAIATAAAARGPGS